MSNFHSPLRDRWGTWSGDIRRKRHSLIFVGTAGMPDLYPLRRRDVEMELNSRRRRVETDLPRRSIRCQLDAISGRCPTILRLSSFPTFSIIRLILRPLPIAMERADIKPMRIELFDFLPFHVNPSKLARVQLRITMTRREIAMRHPTIHTCTHTYTRHTPRHASSDSYCIVQKSVDNNLVVYCENYDGQ